MTTLPGRNRPGGGQCIVKTAGHHMLEPEPGALRGLFPRPLDIRHSAEAREPAPVLVQQYVGSEHEIRAFVVGDEVIGYRVDKLDPAQLWVDPDSVVVERVELPAGLATRLLALCRFWRLHVAAFDLLARGVRPRVPGGQRELRLALVRAPGAGRRGLHRRAPLGRRTLRAPRGDHLGAEVGPVIAGRADRRSPRTGGSGLLCSAASDRWEPGAESVRPNRRWRTVQRRSAPLRLGPLPRSSSVAR
ncbi:hypothetical protein [Saccharopolyspora gregorii]|uniref:hypothetical protein n=1 Tax=Saccharopolyspora gregorii TaxID=33914 RepID=UPI0031EDB95F